MAKWNEKDQSHTNWIQDIAQAKRLVREHLFLVEESSIPGDTVVINESSRHYDPLKGLHTSIIDYSDQIRPYRKRVNGEWEETLYSVESPFAEEISLAKLPKWRKRTISFQQEQSSAISGSSQSVVQQRVWIPPLAASECYYQLNDIVEELKLAAELPEPEFDPETEPPL